MTVKVFRSSDYGAPTNTNTAGSLIAILDACLVNGYGSQTVSALTVTAGVATVTVPVIHYLKDGTFMRISGASDSAFNGDFPITVVNGFSFSYPVSSGLSGTIGGTITSKVAPVGWTKPFSGTNLAVYKQGTGSNGMYLRIDDTFTCSSTQFAGARCYENMTDVNTGTGFWADVRIYKSGQAAATVYEWQIFATEKMMYANIVNGWNNTFFAFGDFVSKKVGDVFNTMVIGNENSIYASPYFSVHNGLGALANHAIARAHTQVGAGIGCGKESGHYNAGYMGTSNIPFPNPIDGAWHLDKVRVTEGAAGIRGTLPGLWTPLHNMAFSNGSVINGTGDLAGKKFHVLSGSYNSSGQVLIEISNTW